MAEGKMLDASTIEDKLVTLTNNMELLEHLHGYFSEREDVRKLFGHDVDLISTALGHVRSAFDDLDNTLMDDNASAQARYLRAEQIENRLLVKELLDTQEALRRQDAEDQTQEATNA